jgi:formamidopyrimidine-DNA glycosylase
MPELPEVETIVRALAPQLLEEVISDVQVRWPRSIATPPMEEFARHAVGQQVLGVARRGKFVVLTLTSATLLVHLRMTGRLLITSQANEAVPEDVYTRVLIRFVSGKALRFRDTRKFGRFYLVADPAAILSGLGAEPLDPGLTPDRLRALLDGHRRQLKPLLLDQRYIAGLGNIYVDETLWGARIHPQRHADTLTNNEFERLHAAMRQVLACAIEHRGTTLRDYRTPNEEPGANQFCLMAYGRKGEPCKRCGSTIMRMLVGQRSTYYCPVCQPIVGS